MLFLTCSMFRRKSRVSRTNSGRMEEERQGDRRWWMNLEIRLVGCLTIEQMGRKGYRQGREGFLILWILGRQ